MRLMAHAIYLDKTQNLMCVSSFHVFELTINMYNKLALRTLCTCGGTLHILIHMPEPVKLNCQA